ncbi:unnamed protein product [Clonostachys solani]|uniref:Xylanolytic transcriptional activator regulatory domain-containing protein n=1 Tax=Clonostachys solani TaxID=160281 RepID=A0A9N9Z311_9HYPO|nr:unnamed protein product [Clonostachys solani]
MTERLHLVQSTAGVINQPSFVHSVCCERTQGPTQCRTRHLRSRSRYCPWPVNNVEEAKERFETAYSDSTYIRRLKNGNSAIVWHPDADLVPNPDGSVLCLMSWNSLLIEPNVNECRKARVQQLEDSIQNHLSELETLKQLSDSSSKSQPLLTESAPSNERDIEVSTPVVMVQSERPDSPLVLPSLTPGKHDAVTAPEHSSSSSREKEAVYPLSAEAIVSLSKMSESNEYGLFNSTSVAYAMLAADGGSPFGSSVLRSNIFQDDSHISQELELSKMLESFLLNQGETLLARYERNCHSRYPFIQMDKLNGTMESCKAQGSLQPIQRATSAERFHFFTVMAIGLAMEGRRISFAGQIEGNLFMVAINHLGGIFRFSDPIDQVRGLLLLTIYSMFRSSTGSTWHLAGFAMRICIAHSYHTGEHSENIHKTFWSTFMLEQTICDALERLPSLGHVDLLSQPCYSNRTGNISSVADDAWSYWVTRSQLHAKLSNNTGVYSSSTQSLFSIYQLKARQPGLPPENASLATSVFTKDVDQQYLSDLISFISRINSTPSRKLDQFCLFVSALTIRRLTSLEDTLPSWPTGILLFRAGLICLRSMGVLVIIEDSNRLDLILSDTLRKCSDYLSRLCSEFQELAHYRVIFDTAVSLHDCTTSKATQWTITPEIPPSVASLSAVLDQKLSRQAFEAIQAGALQNDAFNSDIHAGLTRLVSGICYESDEERQLYDGIFSSRQLTNLA